MKQLTWQERTALYEGKIIGYYISEQQGFRMVFFQDGVHPKEANASSEQQDKDWITEQWQKN